MRRKAEVVRNPGRGRPVERRGRCEQKSRCRWGHMHLQALLLPGRNHPSVVGAVSVALHFLLPILLMNLKEHAANCFMRDSICDCDVAKGFLLLHHTMYYCWPLISGNAVFWVIGLGRRFLMRRVASLQEFIYCQKVLHFEI